MLYKKPLSLLTETKAVLLYFVLFGQLISEYGLYQNVRVYAVEIVVGVIGVRACGILIGLYLHHIHVNLRNVCKHRISPILLCALKRVHILIVVKKNGASVR